MQLRSVFDKIISSFKEQNPTISPEAFEKIQAEVEKRVHGEPPPRIALVGDSGVGKSSTINALFNAGQATSHTEACTVDATAIEVPCQNGTIIVYDMPGLNESIASQDQHLRVYHQVLSDVDVALWILDAQYRAVGTVQAAILNEISRIDRDLPRRIIFALNKVDLVAPGQTAWHPHANIPSEEQEKNIQARIKDVHKKMTQAIPRWEGTVIGYSAEKRYNLPHLFATMLDGVSLKRRWVVSSRKSLADFLELVNPAYLPEDRRAKVDGSPSPSLDRTQAPTQPPPTNRESVMAFLKSLSREELDELAPDLKGLINKSTRP